ncbi:MAG: flavin reductase family protein [Chloroflexota bacterium]
MAKIEIDYRDVFAQTVDSLLGGGLLLATQGADGRANAMTIGWGLVGTIWRKPIFLCLVRPSRHSYTNLEQNGDFTVNLMPAELDEALAYCGEHSGRDGDKLAAQGLKTAPGSKVQAPVIEQALLQYECRAVQRTDVVPEAFDPAIVAKFYASGDFHRVYFGEIVAVHAEEGFVQK